MKNTVRRVTIHYSLIHALYWMTHCLMFNFASAFMLDCGYSNSQIGIVIGLSCAFSAILQPGLGAFFSRSNVKLNLSVAGLYLPIILLTLLMITLPMNRFFLGAAMVAVFAMQSMLQPGINSLHRGYVHQGMHINYGLARGVGSISFALASFVVGQLLRRFATSIIPLLYLCSAAILALVIFLFHAPQDREEGNMRKNDISYSAMLRQHRHFTWFLIGVLCIFLTHMFIENFLLQIMMQAGGDSANLGIALALSSGLELPAMLLYTALSKKINLRKIMLAAIWIWILRDLLTLIAQSPRELYIAQMLNFASCAVYLPAMLDYVGFALPERLFVRGVALAGTANTLGNLFSTIGGGWMLDSLGIHTSLAIVQVFAISGAIVLTMVLRKQKEEVCVVVK